MRGVRPTSAASSRRARASANSSSALPPATISAMMTAARSSPSAMRAGDGEQCDDIDAEHTTPQCGYQVSKDDEPDQESWNDPGQWTDHKAGGEAKQNDRQQKAPQRWQGLHPEFPGITQQWPAQDMSPPFIVSIPWYGRTSVLSLVRFGQS